MCNLYIHAGTHHSWIEAVLHSPNLPRFLLSAFLRLHVLLRRMAESTGDKDVLFIVACKSGVHRSVAAAHLLATALRIIGNFNEHICLYPAAVQCLSAAIDEFIHCVDSTHHGRLCEVCRDKPWEDKWVVNPLKSMVPQWWAQAASMS